MMQTKDQLASQLKDIKPPVTISDWSIYLYWGIVMLAIVGLLVSLYFLYRAFGKLRRTNRRKEYMEALKQINWSNSKQSAYRATRLGRLLLGDEEDRLHELYNQMVSELEAYKYKKEVGPISPDAKAQFDIFVKACDESF